MDSIDFFAIPVWEWDPAAIADSHEWELWDFFDILTRAVDIIFCWCWLFV